MFSESDDIDEMTRLIEPEYMLVKDTLSLGEVEKIEAYCRILELVELTNGNRPNDTLYRVRRRKANHEEPNVYEVYTQSSQQLVHMPTKYLTNTEFHNLTNQQESTMIFRSEDFVWAFLEEEYIWVPAMYIGYNFFKSLRSRQAYDVDILTGFLKGTRRTANIIRPHKLYY
ncbi:hypothetical protein BDN70DRAFT_900863 [Pholiota conissans]|uniref:Uncharacterized protein n=1 Tax=Pholiota conissans TaxID=109636 RepID=A0A9P5YLJ0_9AGAR|nr:hypothetical protein BDN70DRAFT_900863 [Pholiota conissans]